MYISNQKIEEAFGKKVVPYITSLGVDTASRTGWCKLVTTKDNVQLDYGFIDIETTDKYYKYNKFIELFSTMVNTDKLVIEESFFGQNAKTFQMLSRLGGFVYAIAHIHGQTDKRFLLATSARKYLGLKGNAKKEIIQEEFKKRLSLDLTDDDIIDAIILALNGVLK